MNNKKTNVIGKPVLIGYCCRHSHNGLPCQPPEEDASTSRTVETEDKDGLGERDRYQLDKSSSHFQDIFLRFSLYQQKYRFLETNAGYLLLDSKERVRLSRLLSRLSCSHTICR